MKTVLSALAASMLVLSFSMPVSAAGKQSKPKATVVEKETGPVGFGPLKIGMTKSAVEALTSGDVYLASPLELAPVKNAEPDPTKERYSSTLMTPVSTTPVKISLTFVNGALSFLSMSATEQNSVITKLSSQVQEKYGEGSFSDNTRDEQCLYRNGANFTIKNGDAARMWSQQGSGGTTIQTTFRRALMDMCPSNLRYDGITKMTLEMLSIEELQQAKQPAAKNLF
ncbi:hypothetical protein [Comamonas thiooxydans]|uniref:hypothetical protein n=1 Tax=Comamonas thiooxydans TaxID=363952 RepID=UPI0006A8B5FA|nr:hypothetical protein [Comamonas thiooxydans]CUA99334.1 hypothetical protein Ga0061062_10898 [Comamonas thiooxydans]